MSALLPALFEPGPVGVGETTWQEPLAHLAPEEALAVQGAVPRRHLEFRAGREAARRALRQVGGPAGPVPSAADRSPIWPAGFVGSITHTGDVERGWAGAVVAPDIDVLSVGLDAELDEPLQRELWPLVLTGDEQEWLSTLTPGLSERVAKLIFSAKECVYKLQYPVTRTFLDFGDVEVDVDLECRWFLATFRRKVGRAFAAGEGVVGRFACSNGLWLTGALLHREAEGLLAR